MEEFNDVQLDGYQLSDLMTILKNVIAIQMKDIPMKIRLN